jgi:hypothetical protein
MGFPVLLNHTLWTCICCSLKLIHGGCVTLLLPGPACARLLWTVFNNDGVSTFIFTPHLSVSNCVLASLPGCSVNTSTQHVVLSSHPAPPVVSPCEPWPCQLLPWSQHDFCPLCFSPSTIVMLANTTITSCLDSPPNRCPRVLTSPL